MNFLDVGQCHAEADILFVQVASKLKHQAVNEWLDVGVIHHGPELSPLDRLGQSFCVIQLYRL